MTEQLAIDATPTTITPAGKPLTAKQQKAYDLVKSTPGGITADELGARFHADRGKHHPDTRCTFCAKEGLGVLASVAVAPLVIRRRVSGRYEPRDGSGTPAVSSSSSSSSSSQLSELPGDSWEDIFGSEAA